MTKPDLKSLRFGGFLTTVIVTGGRASTGARKFLDKVSTENPSGGQEGDAEFRIALGIDPTEPIALEGLKRLGNDAAQQLAGFRDDGNPHFLNSGRRDLTQTPGTK
jgi:hypothetical protein